MTYQIDQLEVQIKGLLPALDRNLSAVHELYMSGEKPNGAYQHTLRRHANALTLAHLTDVKNGGNADLAPDEDLFKAGALLFMDLEHAVEDAPEAEKAETQQKIDALTQLYLDSGFTEKHFFFGYPMQKRRAVAEIY